MLKTYDGLFIFSSSLKDEALDAALEKVRKQIETLGGQALHTRPIGVRTFARHMKKRTSGCYARLSFEIDPEKVAQLHQRFKHDESVFRVQITVPDPRTAADMATEELESAAAEPAAASVPQPNPEQEKHHG